MGGLNWLKFAERIGQQVATNVNLTAEQRRLMSINLIVALIHSNQLEQARKEWEKFRGSSTTFVNGIGAYFALKDKKFEEALGLVKGEDAYSIFLRAQIHLANKQTKIAFEGLARSLNEQLIGNDEYLSFLLKSCVNHKIS